ncbi:MAG TPA: RIP metalloprotease RseP [Arenicellales bacterium]|nr:RIP metalloprotease RseP [Arenicellales bacterium]
MNDFLFSIGGFILAIGLLVAVHEFGHFWVARRLGVKVLRFSIGFGRPLWSRRGRDDVEYVIAALPLGGYVKMLDENEQDDIPPEEVHRAFNRQPLWRRTAVVVAGPLFNFLFALVAYWLVFMAGVDGVKPVVGAVVDGSLAERGGFRVGDEILTVDGREARSWDEHRLYLFNQALARNQVPVRVRTAEGEIATRQLLLDQVPLSELDAGLIENGVGLYGYVPEIPPVVGAVQEGSPAEAAGLQTGDRILSVDGGRLEDWRDLVNAVRPLAGQTALLAVERDGRRLEMELRPEPVETPQGTIGRIGIAPQPVSLPDEYRVHVSYGPLDAVAKSAGSVWVMSVLTVKMLAKIVTLEVSAKNISGPLTIAQFAGDTVQIGWDRFILFLAIVSISLGVLNLLPIPVLDGGHLLYYAAEAVTGKPPSEQVMIWGQQIGLAMLFALMSLAFYNDIVRLLQ